MTLGLIWCRPGELPLEVTGFVGRQRELAGLAGLRDPGLLPHTVATCLGLPEPDARSGAEAIVRYLRDRELLLILATCEHLIGACADLAGRVLRHAPGVTVLATSRQPLDLPGEHPYPIPPLPVPGSGPVQASRGDAVELFAQRARRFRSGLRRHRGQPGRRDPAVPPKRSAPAARWPVRTSCPP